MLNHLQDFLVTNLRFIIQFTSFSCERIFLPINISFQWTFKWPEHIKIVYCKSLVKKRRMFIFVVLFYSNIYQGSWLTSVRAIIKCLHMIRTCLNRLLRDFQYLFIEQFVTTIPHHYTVIQCSYFTCRIRWFLRYCVSREREILVKGIQRRNLFTFPVVLIVLMN